ncbi:MAG: ABC transporter ATP-binding protein [Alphaproteobacteria bacterium]
MADAHVELSGLGRSYGETVAVAAIDLAIARGEFVVLLGPSGSGKTTVLGMVGGFVRPSRGRVLIDGADVTELSPAQRPTTTVFQDYALFPHMSVAGNVGFGLAMRKVPRPERERRVAEALDLVNLTGFGRRGVHELSGGQRQRVALARAIAVAPSVLLLDEPLGALDLALRRQMQDELVALQKRLGTTFIHVTHDQEEAMSIADTVVVLNHGRIEDSGPPRRVYARPRTLFSATFMGESNLIEGTVEAREGALPRIATALGPLVVPGAGEPGDAVVLVVRPEHIAPEGHDDGRPRLALGHARIASAVFQGNYVRATAISLVDGRSVRLNLPPAARIAPDDELALTAAAEDVVVLPRGA